MRDVTEMKALRRSVPGLAALAGVALALIASPAVAQEDARWLPWVGCWEAVDDDYAPEGMLCVRPTAGGVEMLTVVDGEVVASEALSADGRSHPIDREGCTGSQTARFSADGRRLFLSSEHTCEGEFRREATGLIAMTSPTGWIDVQVVDVGGRDMAWVRHYRLAPQSRVEEAGLAGIAVGRGMALRTARHAAAAAADVGDVVEATRVVSAEAVRAWVAELRDPFDLDAERLVELADAGVDPEIIDVMVAVTYPEHFSVERDAVEADRVADGYRPRRGYAPIYGYWGSRYFYDPYYSPYRYGSYGYGGYGGYRPTVVVITPSSDDDGRRGRLVNGRGYTRGTRSGSTGGSRPSVRTTGGSSRGSASVGSGSGGSKSGSTGRKAKRRGGGGGDDGGGGTF